MRCARREWLASVALLSVLAAGVPAQQHDRASPSVAPHEHTPVELDGTPIVARIDLSVQRPRRVLLDRTGGLYVVDAGAGRVLRRGPDGEMTTLAEGLDEPTGLALGRDGQVYVANHAGGRERRGSILRIPPRGRPAVLVDGLTGPGALAVSPRGTLFVALPEAGEIATVDGDGRISTYVKDIAAPAGLAFDRGGDLLVASADAGRLSRITADRQVHIVARGLEFPTDVAVDSRGRAIVACYGGGELSEIDDEGRVAPFASVTPGTIGLALDADDNVYLANWDFRFVLRMTLHLSVPCPHCDKRIPVRIRSRPDDEPRNVF
ncbi:MAG TPA: hypothetical protein VML55_13010 [Planctomycetaceae bacterium]|nr:hypothetical protein [Planctomycetaceae bacterium]